MQKFINLVKRPTIENLTIAVAWSLPRKLVMWCAFRVGAHATQGEYSNQVVPDLSFIDALKRWPA
jgi:hypothetical protein